MPKLLFKPNTKDLTIPEAAKELGISERTLYRWIKRGFIKTIIAEYPKGNLRIPANEVKKHRRANGRK